MKILWDISTRLYFRKENSQTYVKALSGTRVLIAEYKLSSSVSGESQVCSPWHQISDLTLAEGQKTHIRSSRIVCGSRLVCSCVGSATDILCTIITRASLITQVNMDVGNMNNLNWRFSTGSWTSGIGFGAHGNCVGFYIWPLTKSKDCKAEELRGPGADCHDSEVVGKNRTFESDGSSAEKSVEIKSNFT